MEININEAFAGEDIGVDEKVSVRHGFAPPTSESSVGSYNIAKDKKEYYNRYIRRAPDDISISQKSQWTTISHSSSAL